MALQRHDAVGFTRGLITDVLGVEGGLLEANDVYSNRDGEIRKRGGKPAIVQVTSAGEGLQFAQSAISDAALGTLINYYDGSSAWRIGVRGSSGSFITMGTARLNSAGATPTGFGFDTFWNLFSHNGEILSAPGFYYGYAPIRWKGSVKARYATGTVSTTSGSTTITGVGTLWAANVEEGMYLHINSGTLAQRTFLIVGVDSNTSLRVDKAPDATVAGVGYSAMSVGAVTAATGIFGTDCFPVAGTACSHQGRMFLGQTWEGATTAAARWYDERIRWSALPTEGSGKFVGCDYWHANGYTDIGTGIGGAIKGLASTGDELIIFKTAAVYALRGVIATDGSDLGANVTLVSANHGCINRKGYRMTPIGLVFCDQRGAFVYSNGQIRSLTHGRVQRYWEENMSAVWPSVVGDRIIFLDQEAGYIMVYDMTNDSWWTQSPAIWADVVQTYNLTSGVREYEMGFRRTSDMTDNWEGDLDSVVSTDAWQPSYPVPSIATHPIQIAPAGGNARPVRVDVNGYATGGIEVSLRENRAANPPQGVGTIPAGTTDASHRLRVQPGFPLTSTVQVVLEGATMSDARIYGVSLLTAPSGRVDP